MTNKPKNPWAFPCVAAPQYLQEGMTLRDYFAANAMQALITNNESSGAILKTANKQDLGIFDVTALMSYRYADAMLRERERINIDKYNGGINELTKQ